MKRLYLLLGLLVLAIVAARFKSSIRKIIPPVAGEFMNHQTVAQRLQQYGRAARGRMERHFAEAKVRADSLYQEIRIRLAELPLEKPDGR